MPTSLSCNGYKIVKKEYTNAEIKAIKDELSVKPFVYNQKNDSKFQVYLESPKKLYLPRFFGLERFGQPVNDTMNEGEDIEIDFNGKLRDEQVPIEETYLDSAKKKGGGIISLRCGGGKTVLALHIFYRLQKKAIVVVHKDFLMTQWRDRIKQFLPEARIGKIQQNTVDIENKDIVLAMVQSLSMKEYDDETFDSFGLAIFDECHHLGAEVFHRSMSKVASKYMLGLSATPKRKDGLTKVFEWYIGPIVFSQKTKNNDYAEVQLIPFESDDVQYSKIELNFRKEPCMPKMINNICGYKKRTNVIIDLLKKYYNEDRNILILSDRRGHLEEISKIISDYSWGFYVGGMKPEQLRESQQKRILLATFSMASEGMDIPSLDTVILSSPKSDVEQSVGRIFRKKQCDRIRHPLIIDIQDKFSSFDKQSQKRVQFYHKMNFTIYCDGEKIEPKKKGRKKKKVEIPQFALIDDDE
jgi:superfamily II DNA or RNA helicase